MVELNHRIVFKGEVLSSEVQRRRRETLLKIRADEYYLGSGPRVTTVRVKAIETKKVGTYKPHAAWSTEPAAGEEFAFKIPRPGSVALFWIAVDQGDHAQIVEQEAIWPIIDDRLQLPIELDLTEVRSCLQELVEQTSIEAQARLADGCIRFRYLDTERGTSVTRPDSLGIETKYLRHHVAVVDTVWGLYLTPGETITILLEESHPILKQYWTGGRGLLFIRRSESPGVYEPTHPRWAFLPEFNGKYVMGYRLAPDVREARVEPIALSLEEIRETTQK